MRVSIATGGERDRAERLAYGLVERVPLIVRVTWSTWKEASVTGTEDEEVL